MKKSNTLTKVLGALSLGALVMAGCKSKEPEGEGSGGAATTEGEGGATTGEGEGGSCSGEGGSCGGK